MVAKGMSYKQIAERLVLSHRTVQNHVQNTLRKLQMHNRVELTRYAIEQGLDDEPEEMTRRADDLLEIADELYALALGDFTPARDAKVKELKGDRPRGPGQVAEEAVARGVGGQPAGPPRGRAGRAGARRSAPPCARRRPRCRATSSGR